MTTTSPNFACHASLAAFSFLIFICVAQAQQAPITVADTKQQLSPGKTPGTYAFSYSGTVAFTQEPAFPVSVGIQDYGHKTVLQIPVNDSNPFTISADLAPGGYWIESSVAPDKTHLYWGSQLDQVFIDPTGLETIHNFQSVLLHQKMITVLSPDPKGTSTITEKRPLLTWQALPGAVNYNVYWLVEDAPQVVSAHGSGETNETQFRLTEDTIPNRRYEWGVDARGKNGEQLGYWAAAYFFTPGGKEAFAKAPALVERPSKGTPYLGISPIKLFGGPGMALGITINSVGAGSPALKAGLQPHDLLTSFNGRSLENISLPDFVNLIRAQAVGTVVTIEFVRQGVKKSVPVTVEAMP